MPSFRVGHHLQKVVGHYLHFYYDVIQGVILEEVGKTFKNEAKTNKLCDKRGIEIFDLIFLKGRTKKSLFE